MKVSKSEDVTEVKKEKKIKDGKIKKEKKHKKQEELQTATENTLEINGITPEVNGHSTDKKAKKKEKKNTEPVESGNGHIEGQENGEEQEKKSEPEEDDGPGSFDEYGIAKAIQKNLQDNGITKLFPVQYETFQRTAKGTDVIVQARTGTGKTLSFALPLVQKLHNSTDGKRGRKPKVICLAPTRELACQVMKNFQMLSKKVHVLAVYGGAPYSNQERSLKMGVDVVVGTPGRVNDFVEKGTLNLSDIEHVVLDEVDRMLDMGFADIVEQIIRQCYEKELRPQTLLYSATMPPWVKQTACKYLKENYEHVNMVGDQKMKTSTTIEQLAIGCRWSERPTLVRDIVKVYCGHHGRAIVFCNTKREADELCTGPLSKSSAVLHGDIAQAKRETVIKAFKEGRVKVLITTDVAARGLDIPNVNLVIQTQPPDDMESFVHRTGRTGRAGKSGVAICFYQPREQQRLQACERFAKIQFKHIHCPTPEDIIKASAKDVYTYLDDVPKQTIEYFRESAEKMIEERGQVEALAAAMAVIAGATKIANRSLLSNSEGYTTYLYTTNVPMRGLGFVRGILNRLLGEDADVRQLTFTEDKTGVAFDVNSDLADNLEAFESREGETLEKAKTLPTMQQRESFSGGRGGRGFGGRGGGFQRGRGNFQRGGGGGRGGGRGFGRGGGGFRGGSRGGGFKRSFGDSGFGSPPVNKIQKFE